MDKFEEELKEILAQSRHKSSGAENFVRASLAENKYPKDFLIYFINSECFGDYESELPAYEAWQYQQAKVEELQNDVSIMLASHKRMSVGLLQQQDKIEKLIKERDELQKRVDAALNQIQGNLQYVEQDRRGNFEFLQMAMIRAFKELEKTLEVPNAISD